MLAPEPRAALQQLQRYGLRTHGTRRWHRAISTSSIRRNGDVNVPSTALSSEFVSQYKKSFKRIEDDWDKWHRPSNVNKSGTSTGHDASTGPKLEVGNKVRLYGFLSKRREISKELAFAELSRDASSAPVQVVIRRKDNEDADALFRSIRPHSAVCVKGRIVARARTKPRGEPITIDSTEQPSLPVSQSMLLDTPEVLQSVELVIEGLEELSSWPADITVSNDVRFGANKRHLQIRFEESLRQRLVARARLLAAVREELQTDCLEVETPILFKSTPEGAREFLVPTRTPGYAYALPQSPQQYKQILMATGIGRYFQIARCFRDEDLRADRQPEFTQVDIELPFADGELVMHRVERLVRNVYVKIYGEHRSPVAHLQDVISIPRMTYQQAMDEHGVDKPDLRIKDLITRVDHLLPANLVGMMTSIQKPVIEASKFNISGNPRITRSFFSAFMDSPEAQPFQKNPDGPPGVFIVDPTKPLDGLQAFNFEGHSAIMDHFSATPLEAGNLLILQARPDIPHAGGSTSLGRLRKLLHKAAISAGHIEQDASHNYLWVTGFPLFTPAAADPTAPGQGGSRGLISTHHPFTAPLTAHDVSLLLTDPLAAQADHYDLVLNGVELGGGSRRIHNVQVQKYVMREVLGMSPARIADFEHLFEALRSGCPPHAGIALGFDRWVALLTGTESVRDVIAFPKNGRGVDEMVGSPSAMSEGQLGTYHLVVKEACGPGVGDKDEI